MSYIVLREADAIEGNPEHLASLPFSNIRNLTALERACERCGLVFKRDQTTFHNWATDHGRLAGDSPLPAGMSEAEVGRCEHAIGLPKAEQKNYQHGEYEIGLVKSQKQPGTWALAYDAWGGALEAKAGKGLDKLTQYYSVEVAKSTARAMGDMLREQQMADGSIVLTIDTTARLGV